MSQNSSEFEKKIGSLLADPDALAGIINMVRKLGPLTTSEEKSTYSKPIETQATESSKTIAQSGLSENIFDSHQFAKNDIASGKSIGLLLALKPFLSENKCEKIDVITKLLKIATLTDLLK